MHKVHIYTLTGKTLPHIKKMLKKEIMERLIYKKFKFQKLPKLKRNVKE